MISLRSKPLLGLVVLCLALVGCKGSGSSSSSTASIRVANATLTHPSLDLLVNATSTLSATAADAVSAYASVPSGGPTLQLNDAGNATALITTSPTLIGAGHYTLLAYESGGVVATALLPEDTAAPGTGTAQIRFFVAAVDAGKLDIYVTNPNDDLSAISTPFATSPVITNAFSTQYVDKAPGTYRVRVTGAGNKADLRMDLPVTLAAQQLGTVILTPASGGVLLNGSSIIQQGAYAATRNTNARVRIATSVSALATVSAIATSAGGNVAIDSGSVAPTYSSYTLVPANSTLNVSVNNQSVGVAGAALKVGGDATLFVYGDPAAATATVVTDDNRTPSDPTTIKLRLINGITGVAGKLSLTANSAPVASSVPPGTVSGYVTVAGGTSGNAMNFVLNSSNHSNPYLKDSTNVLNLKGVYTVMAVGDAGAPVLLVLY